MGLLPTLDTEYTEREVTDVFRGYNHQLKIGDGEFFDMENLTSAYYPLLANRHKRGIVRTFDDPGGIIAKDALAWVDGGTLYYNGEATPVTGMAPGEKLLVSMGAYIIIFPDKRFYNTIDPTDYGSMESTYTSTGVVKYRMCKMDGTEYSTPTVSPTEPVSPQNGDLWVDTSQDVHVLRQYSSAADEWTAIPTVYTKITFISEGELPGLFGEYDGVTISGAEPDVNGDKVIYKIGGDSGTLDYMIVVGLLEQAVDQTTGVLKIERKVPDLDYVIECQNRLWGCRYGDGLNELYCCALGDFKNWRQYMGLSTDSWTASVGANGEWTGAVNYLGYPTFFKEDRLYRISISAGGAHSVSETVCRGVQKGSSRSLVVVNETLLYKTRGEVCAYQGSFPESISDALGDVVYHDAVAGAVGDRYYISMLDADDKPALFVFDLKRGLWMKEDDLRVVQFERMGDELYAVTEKHRLLAMNGSDGTLEPFVSWAAETGIMYYQYPDRKYVSRFNCRLQMEEGAELTFYIQYDSDGEWVRQGNVRFKGTTTYTLPIRPRRCDHLQIRLEGKGELRLFSIARVLSLGSDVYPHWGGRYDTI